MTNKYNLGSKSDMRKFEKNLKEAMLDKTKEIAIDRKYDIKCPGCGDEISVPVGKSSCPNCSSEIDFNLKFDF